MKVPAYILRKMGIRSDSQGIIDRYIRVSGAWEEHLQNTRRFILKAVAGKRIRNLAVYGSGWLLDLPLDELAGTAEQVQLYDLLHPPQVLHRLRKYRNVSAISEDITGGSVVKTYLSVRTYKRTGRMVPAEQLCNQVFQPAVLPDYSISLNILSQVGVLITDYLKLYVPYTPEQIDHINGMLQQHHLHLLERGKSCLITDTIEVSFDMEKDVETLRTGVISCMLPQADNSTTWDWQFDPLGEYKTGDKTVMKVVALEL